MSFFYIIYLHVQRKSIIDTSSWQAPPFFQKLQDNKKKKIPSFVLCV